MEEPRQHISKGEPLEIRFIEVIQDPQEPEVQSKMNKDCPKFGSEVVWEGKEKITLIYKQCWSKGHDNF